MNLRALRLGLTTVLGLARRGFFIPHRHAGDLPRPGANAPYEAVRRRFVECEATFRDILSLVESFGDDLRDIGAGPPPAPRWEQDWFPRLDAAILYALLRHERPSRVVEVGSGHSTRFIARAVSDGAFPCTVTSVDPGPRAALSGLDVQFLTMTVQEAGTKPFDTLRTGDFLVIDSSHVLMPGSDVDIVLNRVLPVLPEGVWIHFHDVFLPDDYPTEWGWRGYNEQTAVAQLVFGDYETVFSSRYMTTAMPATFDTSVARRLPIPPGAFESSLWLRKASRTRRGRGGTDERNRQLAQTRNT